MGIPDGYLPGAFILDRVAAGGVCAIPAAVPLAEWCRRMVELASGGPDMPLEDVTELAVSWLAHSSHTEQTVRRDANEIGRFLASSRLRGARTLGDLTEELVREYLEEPVPKHGRLRGCSAKTVKFRLSIIRKLFSILDGLGIPAVDPAAGIKGPTLTAPLTRPLTDGEMDRVRDSADRTLTDTLGPAAVALAEAGGKTGEIAAVTVSDLNLEKATVVLGGGRTQRVNTLTPWGTDSLRSHLEAQALTVDAPVLVAPATIGYSATSSVSTTITEILRAAGLGADPRIRPGSIRAWSGQKEYERTGDLIACARWLGLESLDTAADLIGLNWRER